MTKEHKQLSKRSIVAIEGSLATFVGLFSGGGTVFGLWIMEWLGWSRHPGHVGHWHLLPESIRYNAYIIVSTILVGAVIGAVVGGIVHVRKITRPWKPSWKGRDD